MPSPKKYPVSRAKLIAWLKSLPADHRFYTGTINLTCVFGQYLVILGYPNGTADYHVRSRPNWADRTISAFDSEQDNLSAKGKPFTPAVALKILYRTTRGQKKPTTTGV